MMQPLLKKSVWMGLSGLLLTACARPTYSTTSTGQTGAPAVVQDTAIRRPATPQAGKIRPAGVQTPGVQVPAAER
ncbi:MAG: hypothetical protein EOP52_08795 [Sphingobacteriales bacterium]|nr:MAG: hypothetical protein EOP52_08795 [Sphingobacteriales bacterium]